MKHTLTPKAVAKFAEYGVPEDIAESLTGYIERGWEPGGWLRAVVENDLMNAFGRADATGKASLEAVTKWLYNWAPSACWGSRQKVALWLIAAQEEAGS